VEKKVGTYFNQSGIIKGPFDFDSFIDLQNFFYIFFKDLIEKFNILIK
jgi:histidinol phosphatase-like enzyme